MVFGTTSKPENHALLESFEIQRQIHAVVPESYTPLLNDVELTGTDYRDLNRVIEIEDKDIHGNGIYHVYLLRKKAER